MLERAENKKNDDLKKSIGVSVILHSVIVSLFLIRSVFFSEPLIDLSSAISVSVGALPAPNKLPEKAQAPAEEPAAPEPEPEPVAAEPETPAPAKPVVKEPPAKAPPKETVNLEKSKARQKEALDRLKKLSALEKIKQDVRKENSARRPSGPVKPRVIAAGTPLGGLDQLQANDYLSGVDQNIKQVWTLPQWLMNKPFKTQIQVRFSAQGQILATKIISSSGNSTYDQYCLDAIAKAAPFPPVPEKLSEKFREDGVVIGFPE